MSFREAAIAHFGEPWVKALEASAGCHSEEPVPPMGTEERLIFAVMEAFDWKCPDFDWLCPERRGLWGDLYGVTTADLKALLWEQREVVLAAAIRPTSLLGLFAGTFDFLKEEDHERTGGV